MEQILEVYETLVEALGEAGAHKAIIVLDGTAPPRFRTVELALKRQRYAGTVARFPHASVRSLAKRLGVSPRTLRRWRDDAAGNCRSRTQSGAHAVPSPHIHSVE